MATHRLTRASISLPIPIRRPLELLGAVLTPLPLVWFISLFLSSFSPAVYAAGPRYVATSGSDSSDCTNALAPCATIQYAVDAANAGDEIRVATGVYSDVHIRPRNDLTTTGIVTQIIYITKSLSIQGGYTTTNWSLADPNTYPVILDAKFKGRVLYITGHITPTIVGLCMVHGNASGLGGIDSTAKPSEDGGAGVYVITASAILSANWISANGGGYYDKLGGGVYLRDSAATLAHNTIISNVCTCEGAGLFLDSSPAILRENVIQANSTSLKGGGIALYESPAQLSLNLIRDNGAAYGGGLSLMLSPAILSDNLIISNTAYFGYGGGIDIRASDATLVNNVFLQNHADMHGSALYVFLSRPKLIHNTFARNSNSSYSEGISIFVDNFSSAALTNTIIADPTNELYPAKNLSVTAISVTQGSTVSLVGVLWSNNTVNAGGAGVINVTNAYTGSPAFLADGYHLSAVSAALDRGVTTGFTADIDNDIRPSGDAPDFGADEYVGPPATHTYFPLIARWEQFLANNWQPD